MPFSVNIESGLVRAYLVSFLEMAFSQGSAITSLISTNKIQVVPVSLAKDGFMLNTILSILDDKEVYSLDYVNNNPTLPHESFRDTFVMKEQIMGMMALDNKATLIIGNDFMGPTSSGGSTLQCQVKQMQELQQCLNCLRENMDAIVKEECYTTVGEKCNSMQEICSTCRE